MDDLDDLLGERLPRPKWLELAAELEACAVNERRSRLPAEPNTKDVKRLHAPLKLKLVRPGPKASKRRRKGA